MDEPLWQKAIQALVWRIRPIIYKMGGRPRTGSIWFSPSGALIYGFRDASRAAESRQPLEGGTP